MSNGAYNDPNLTTLTIDDFTPGVYAFGRGNYSYSSAGTKAPLGSACQSYRCYAKKNVGLIPFPRYSQTASGLTPLFQPAVASMVGAGHMIIGGIKPVIVNANPNQPQMPDILGYNAVSYPQGSAGNTLFQLVYIAGTTTPTATQFYSNNHVASGYIPGPLDVAFFQYGSPPVPQRSVVCIDPTASGAGTATWVTMPAWDNSHSSALFSTTPTTAFVSSPKIFYVNGRVCTVFLGESTLIPSSTFYNASVDAVWCFDIQAMTITAGTTFNPNYFYPELGVEIGSWGSISDGEFFFVYRGGGGVIIYGDIDQPSSVVKLPGVVGTGAAIGDSAQTMLGLIYVTDNDGAYIWNGGNTAQKISSQIPDDQLYRTSLAQFGLNFFDWQGYCNVNNDVWGHWYMAANNWMWDLEEGGWWQVEDPTITNFQIHCASVASLNTFYSSEGYGLNSAAGTVHTNIWAWQRGTPMSSYIWTSSPIAAPGQLVDLQWVEICATNPSSFPCTIQIQPMALTFPGTSGVTVPTPNLGVSTNPVTFTIPATTYSYRESVRLGYSDYNMVVRVTAASTGVADTAPAPILHELSLGYSTTRPSSGLN